MSTLQSDTLALLAAALASAGYADRTVLAQLAKAAEARVGPGPGERLRGRPLAAVAWSLATVSSHAAGRYT